MFSKNTIPQRKPFQLSTEQIQEDIEAICNDEEQRNKLYLCLVETPAKENTFSIVEEFLKGTDELEAVVENLQVAKKQIEEIMKELKQKADKIIETAENIKIMKEKN